MSDSYPKPHNFERLLGTIICTPPPLSVEPPVFYNAQALVVQSQELTGQWYFAVYVEAILILWRTSVEASPKKHKATNLTSLCTALLQTLTQSTIVARPLTFHGVQSATGEQVSIRTSFHYAAHHTPKGSLQNRAVVESPRLTLQNWRSRTTWHTRRHLPCCNNGVGYTRWPSTIFLENKIRWGLVSSQLWAFWASQF